MEPVTPQLARTIVKTGQSPRHRRRLTGVEVVIVWALYLASQTLVCWLSLNLVTFLYGGEHSLFGQFTSRPWMLPVMVLISVCENRARWLIRRRKASNR